MPNYINEKFNNNDFSAKKTLERTASKTVRKFTGNFGYDSPLQRVAINIDWCSLMCECLMPEPEEGMTAIWLNENTVLEYLGTGSKHFKHKYQVYMDGQPVAKVLTHTWNKKIIKEGTAKVEIDNHVQYSTSLIEVIENVMIACKMPVIKNISELHIAIDGANHMHEFMNRYMWQRRDRVGMPIMDNKIGRWESGCRVKLKGKACIDPGMFNRSTGLYDHFKIGKGQKYITIYNKTSELEKSHKQYIRDSWDRAGVDSSGTVWRTELRMRSGSIKELKDFDLKKIIDPDYLLQIFKTQCKNFFEFILVKDDSNVTRARIIDLFQFERLRVPLLAKIPRAIVRGAYKAQMAIHNAYANVRLKYLTSKEQIFAALQHITDNVQLYNLDHWYEKKKPQWDLLYLGNRQWAPEDYRQELK